MINKVFPEAILKHFSLNSPTEVVDRVIKVDGTPYRPNIPKNDDTEMKDGVLKLMSDCLEEDPLGRPSFTDVKKKMRQINKGQYVCKIR